MSLDVWTDATSHISGKSIAYNYYVPSQQCCLLQVNLQALSNVHCLLFCSEPMLSVRPITNVQLYFECEKLGLTCTCTEDESGFPDIKHEGQARDGTKHQFKYQAESHLNRDKILESTLMYLK